MISIVNYGLGNILAFQNIYKKLNIECKVVSTKEELKGSEHIILPGVGSFDWAMTKLNDSGMRDTLDTLVIEKKVPVIGICVGMQIMANKSEEGSMNGLGWLDADIKKFDTTKGNKKIQLPHMGWNDIKCCKKNNLFNGLESDAKFYFLHSYYFQESSLNQVLTETNYGECFTSCAHKENIFAVQFHPEKSHQWGERLLKNFSEIKNA